MNDVNILTSNGVNVQASLELLGDMEMYNETLSDFLDMADEKIANLEKFKAEGDMPNYAIAIHALKSDARYLGFLQLGDMAYDSELKAKAGDQAGVEANHPGIMDAVHKMVEISNQYLGRTPGSQPAAATPEQNAMPQAQGVAQPAPAPAPMPQQQPQMAQPQMAQPQMGMPQPQGYPSPMGGQMQPQTEQVYDLATGQMVSQPVQTGAPVSMGGYPAPMSNQMGGYGQPMYNQYGQMPGYGQQMPGYGQQMPGQGMQGQPGYDPMSQALYNQQNAMQYQMQNAALMPKQGTILVVDDSNLVANFVKKIFDSRYDVVIANDGAKAIELCADDAFRQKIKACLLDLNMPNVDGYQVLEDFYNKGYFVKMPIAVISGVEDMESIDRVNKYPIIDILAKPFNERDVQRVVEKCLAAYF